MEGWFYSLDSYDGSKDYDWFTILFSMSGG
jgi:hypothetical protein